MTIKYQFLCHFQASIVLFPLTFSPFLCIFLLYNIPPFFHFLFLKKSYIIFDTIYSFILSYYICRCIYSSNVKVKGQLVRFLLYFPGFINVIYIISIDCKCVHIVNHLTLPCLSLSFNVLIIQVNSSKHQSAYFSLNYKVSIFDSQCNQWFLSCPPVPK